MAIGFTKIRASMLDSSVWMLSKEARILWLTMLLKKDRDQIVRAGVPGLMHAARLTLEETLAALEDLQRPDPYSQSKELEGRRILQVKDGWFVVNGEKYRDYLTPDDRREYNRLKQQEYRRRRAANKLAAQVAGASQAVKDSLDEAHGREAPKEATPLPENFPHVDAEGRPTPEGQP